MSDGFIAKFVNSEIMSKGGNAKPLDDMIKNRCAVFKANGAFVAPAALVWVTAIAAGGDGVAGQGGTAGGKGGDCGQYVVKYPLALVEGNSYSVTVGSGNTVIGSLSLIKGGGGTTIPWTGSVEYKSGLINCGGYGDTPTTAGRNGGQGLDGSQGGTGGTPRAGSYAGGGGGGGAGSPAPFAFFSLGSKGGDGGSSAAGSPGVGYGSGGGGGNGYGQFGGGAGGAGGNGIVIIEW